MRKIKIARIVTVPFTFISLLGLLDFLYEDERFEVYIISGEDPFLEVLKKRYPQMNFYTMPIKRKIHIISDLKVTYSLYHLFKKENFNIVHSHTPKAGLIVAIAGKLAGIPIRLHTFTGQVWAEFKGIKRFFFKTLDNFICLMNSYNYVDSLSQKEFLTQNRVGNSDKLGVLHKGSLAGIDINKFNTLNLKNSQLREELFPDFKGKVILYLGRINDDKGLLELGRAFLKLKESYNLKLMMVGPKEYVSSGLENLLKTLKQDSDVLFEGFVENTEDYYQMCDIFCLPSYREGCPTSVLEASVMGKPVVASDIYGIRDIVIDQETGFLFKVKSELDLQNKLEKLILSDQLCVEMGQRGKEFVCENFSRDLLTKMMIKDYLKFNEASK